MLKRVHTVTTPSGWRCGGLSRRLLALLPLPLPSQPQSTAPPFSKRYAVSCPTLLGERGDELAAEGRDVRDHAAPDRVGGGRETLVYVSEGLLERPRIAPPPPAGVLMGVALSLRGGAGRGRSPPPFRSAAAADWATSPPRPRRGGDRATHRVDAGPARRRRWGRVVTGTYEL